MSLIDAVAWAEVPFDDEADLVALAERCLAADGGLPLAADPAFLRRRWAGPAVANLQGRDREGRLVAAGVARPTGVVQPAGVVPPTGTASGTTFSGLVDPEVRGSGVGSYLLDWGLRDRQGPVLVETESLTAAGAELFASRGLQQVFAEDVMRVDVAAGVRDAGWPGEVALTGWSAESADRFFGVYAAAFRERPGFPGWSAEQWIGELTGDEDFRPGWSVLVTVPGLGDAGFVTAAVDWIVQVGVVPGARGRGIGGSLVREALRRMRADGATEAWLDVNVDNPAASLYRKLGFEDRGRRARFRTP